MGVSAGKQTDLELLDFSKAFDKVNHSFGSLRGNALSWISAFLEKWSQTVVLEGEESGSVLVSSGASPGLSSGASPVSVLHQ